MKLQIGAIWFGYTEKANPVDVAKALLARTQMLLDLDDDQMILGADGKPITGLEFKASILKALGKE